MKKILTLILFSIIFFIFILKIDVLACSIPPNILNRFHVFEEENEIKIKYTLYTWDSFKKEIESDFYKKTWKILNQENINIFSEKYVKEISNLTHNWKKIDLNLEKYIYNEDLANSNNIFFEITYKTWIKKFEEKNDFYLVYDKKIFLEMTNLVHSYIYSDIEESLNSNWYIDFWEERYEKFLFNNKEFWILSELKKEEDESVEYFLSIILINNSPESKAEISTKKEEQISPFVKNNQSSFSKYFEIFFNKDLDFFWKIFLVFFAIIFWALHWLLPGHSKSIIWAYMMQEKDKKSIKKELFILILSITLSHSLFIFFLALIIHFLSFWVWDWSSYAILLNSFLYVVFWIYFTYLWIKKIFYKEKNHSHCSCSACQSKKEKKKWFKNTFFMGIIFWLNPCIDVLILFILSFSIWNIFYATSIVLAFSLWLWIMLGLLAYFVWRWYNFLNWKRSKIISTILDFLILIMWVSILFLWISKFL